MTYRGAQNLIKRGDEAGLRTALDTGLDPNLAAVEGDVPIGRLLIERGATIDTRNKKDETALALATHRGFAEFIDLLVEHGASAA
jgi:ankyrin repeat protein